MNNLHIRKLSDAELLKTIKVKKCEESKLTLEVLHLLREVSRRNLYLQLGFSSLWEYATKELGYSSGSAYRRIESMKLLSDFPEYEAKVKTGELPMSTLSQLQTFFKEQKKACTNSAAQNTTQSTTHLATQKLNISDKKELIEKSFGKSTREVEKFLHAIAPEVVALKDREKTISAHETEIRFAADAELMQLLNRVKDLCGGKNAYPNYNALLKLLAKEYLRKKDPLQKSNPPTPKYFEIKRSDIASKGAVSEKSNQPTSKGASRYIPAETKRQVYARAQGQCEYRNGERRCECRRNLEIDHVHPHALGGVNTVENLQLLCRQHNSTKAELQLAHFAFAR